MASAKPVVHAPDHLPGGYDPIPNLVTSDNVNQFSSGWQTWFDLPLRGIDTETASTDWLLEVDNTLPYNRKLTHASGAADPLVWPMMLHPGTWTARFSMKAGTGLGTISAYIAGAYDYPVNNYPVSLSPSSPDWIFLASNDLNALGGTPFWMVNHSLTQEGGLGGTTGNDSRWSIDKAVVQPTLSTVLAGGTTLDGSSGYYFFKVEVTGAAEIFEIRVSDSGDPQGPPDDRTF